MSADRATIEQRDQTIKQKENFAQWLAGKTGESWIHVGSDSQRKPRSNRVQADICPVMINKYAPNDD